MRQAKIIMGTGVTIDIPEVAEHSIFEAVFKRLEEIDDQYSTYKKTSEVSRFAAGKIAEGKLSAELRKILAACRKAEKDTDGYFSAWAGGNFEPSGYVKGWAINEAGKIIKKGGFKTFCISIGGDIMAAGDKEWRLGIQDPFDKNKIIKLIKPTNGAICTSGNYVRGAHIVNPKTGKPVDELASFTVVGPDVIMADILATAGFAAGFEGLDLVSRKKGYEALAIDKTGRPLMTDGMQPMLV